MSHQDSLDMDQYKGAAVCENWKDGYSPFSRTSSEDAVYLYKISRRNLRKFSRRRADTKFYLVNFNL